MVLQDGENKRREMCEEWGEGTVIAAEQKAELAAAGGEEGGGTEGIQHLKGTEGSGRKKMINN